MAQQTAVEFYDQALRECLMSTVDCDPIQIFEQAKAIEKEQIIKAATLPREQRGYNALKYSNCGEQHYSETYEK